MKIFKGILLVFAGLLGGGVGMAEAQEFNCGPHGLVSDRVACEMLKTMADQAFVEQATMGYRAQVLRPQADTAAQCAQVSKDPLSGKYYDFRIIPDFFAGLVAGGIWGGKGAIRNAATETVGYQGSLVDPGGYLVVNNSRIYVSIFNNPSLPTAYVGAPNVPAGGMVYWTVNLPGKCDIKAANCTPDSQGVVVGSLRVLVSANSCSALLQQDAQAGTQNLYWTSVIPGSQPIRQITLPWTREAEAPIVATSSFVQTPVANKPTNPNWTQTGILVVSLVKQKVSITVTDPITGKDIVTFVTPEIPAGGLYSGEVKDMFPEGTALNFQPSGSAFDFQGGLRLQGSANGKIIPFVVQIGEFAGTAQGITKVQ